MFPSVPWQRCQFHLSRNAQNYALRREEKGRIAADIRDILNWPGLEDAEAMLQRKASEWADDNPVLADWMAENLPEAFAVHQLEQSVPKENTEKRLRSRHVIYFRYGDSDF